MDNLASATLRLRPVEEADASFILSLRLDANLNQHLSAVENDLSKQIDWIRSYKIRETRGAEYYFIVESLRGESYGTVRVYDFRGDSFSWGSWVLRPGTPLFVALETAIAIYDFGFGPLGFERSHFDVRKANRGVTRFHERFGARRTGEDELNFYYELTKAEYLRARDRYSRVLE